MLAIANGGLIGSVSKVEDHSTTVNLLTNTENSDKISVKTCMVLLKFTDYRWL